MEVMIVLLAAVVLLLLILAAVGSAGGRRRATDELVSERGADQPPDEGMGAEPVEDRPAGPGAESQDADAVNRQHPPSQQGPDESALPSDVAGKSRPDRGGEGADRDRS